MDFTLVCVLSAEVSYSVTHYEDLILHSSIGMTKRYTAFLNLEQQNYARMNSTVVRRTTRERDHGPYMPLGWHYDDSKKH